MSLAKIRGPTGSIAFAIKRASLPINTAARSLFSSAGFKSEKSPPLPSPPAIRTIGLSTDSIAAIAAATLVALESLM